MAKCQKCGHQIEPEVESCPRCGADHLWSKQPGAETKRDSLLGFLTLPVVAIVLFLVLAIVGGVTGILTVEAIRSPLGGSMAALLLLAAALGLWRRNRGQEEEESPPAPRIEKIAPEPELDTRALTDITKVAVLQSPQQPFSSLGGQAAGLRKTYEALTTEQLERIQQNPVDLIEGAPALIREILEERRRGAPDYRL